MTSAIETAQALHSAIELGRFGQELEDLFTEDVAFTEYPNRVKPSGGIQGLQDMLTSSRAGARLLAQQRYDVHHASQHGNTAIMRLTWMGTVGADVGPFMVGQQLTAHIAQFITVRDGRISAIASYDCYEPF
jgi:ketosteroid isomerase-like protein